MKKLVLVSLALGLAMTPLMVAVAQSKTQLKERKTSLSRALSNVRSKRNAVRADLKKAEAETNKMMSDIHRVDRQMSDLVDQIDDTSAKLTEAKKRQEKLAKDLIKQTESLDKLRVEVAARVRSMYKAGKSSPITMLVSSQTVGDIAVRNAVLKRIAENDRRMFGELEVLRDMILAKKKEQDRIVAKVHELEVKQRAYLKSLEDKRKDKKQIFSILVAQEDALEDQYEAMQRESHKLESEIYAIQSRLTGVPVFSGRFIRPVNGRLSSSFGYRTHPISGKRKLHTGQDIAAPSGTTIKAAGSGRVIFAGYRNGYGKTVIIDHGGGLSTLYGHCSRLYVSSGQSVKQGQKIAAVGSTGYSTGPHLHFEVRVKGKPVNPNGKY